MGTRASGGPTVLRSVWGLARPVPWSDHRDRAMTPQPGDQAPDFTLPDQGGNPVSLSGLRGKKRMLYFYAKADT